MNRSALARQRNQRVRPFGVGAVGDHASFGLDPVAEERPAGIAMHHGKGRRPSPRRTLRVCSAARARRPESSNFCLVFEEFSNSASITCVEPRLDSFGPGDDERTGAARELRVEQEEGQAGEMIAVKMGDQDQVDVVARDAEPLQRRQRRGAAIDQEIDAVRRVR